MSPNPSSPVVVTRGDGPVIVAMPHVGTDLPDDLWSLLNDRGLELSDTDWHIDRLYVGLLPDATIVKATFHRYAIDVNRDPTGASLYPGQATTDLLPLTDFDGHAIRNEPPTDAERAERLAQVHAPYHAALQAEVERVRARHGVAILWDAHSIRSRIPRLFDGTLPDLNIGTDGGRTCDARVERIIADRAAASGRTHVLNGRFRGGWTTRHYGRPREGWHAIQMEIAQSAYLAEEAPPWTYDEAKARTLRPLLAAMLQALADLAPQLRHP